MSASQKTSHLPADLHRYVVEHALRESPVLAQLRRENDSHPLATMAITPEQGAFMAFLVRLGGVRRILEIGVFTGYSSLAMAEALPEDGELTALDISEEFTAIARQYWRKAGVEQRVDLRLGAALPSLEQLRGEKGKGYYDLCFIDADKVNYDAYYEHCLELTAPGGLILADNAFSLGEVATGQDPMSQALRALNAKVLRDERVDMCLSPIGDGLLMCRVRGD